MRYAFGPVLLLAFTHLVTGPGATAQTMQLQQLRATAAEQEQQDRLDQAEVTWREVLALHPSDADAYGHLGMLEARQSRYKEAIPLYRKALGIDPSMYGLRLNLGLAYFKNGELQDAILTFSQLLKNAPPGSPDALRLVTLIGMAHFGLGEYTAAIPDLRKAAVGDRTNLGLRMALAQSCLAAKQYQCVLDVYREIVNLNAESAEADMLAGEALDEMQNHAGAIEQFRAAVKANSSEPNVHFGLGYLLWTQNQFEEAAAEFRAELANMPDNAQALAYLADSEIQLGKLGDALPPAEKAVSIDPDVERAHVDLGILYSNVNRDDEAIGEFKKAIKLAPKDPDPHWRLGRLYHSLGRTAEAKAEFDLTSRLHKAESDSIASKLKAAQEKGKPEESPTSNQQ